jgi:hypothetical protein
VRKNEKVIRPVDENHEGAECRLSELINDEPSDMQDYSASEYLDILLALEESHEKETLSVNQAGEESFEDWALDDRDEIMVGEWRDVGDYGAKPWSWEAIRRNDVLQPIDE